MSYQHLYNTGMDNQSHSCPVGSVQSTTNQQASFTTSHGLINKTMDKDGNVAHTMAGPAQGAMASHGNVAGQSGLCAMMAKTRAVGPSVPTSFGSQASNLQSYLKMNAQMNANMGRNPNYATGLRMAGQYGTNYILPHGTKRKQKDPNRPKRPTTAYFYFAHVEREEAAKRGERISKVSEWTKRVAEKWRNLSEEERTQFRAMAAEDKTRFDQEMAVYTGKDANKPKRPQSSYFLWLADFRVKMKDKISEHKEILRAAGEEWRKLTMEEKAPYEVLAEEERKKYEERMKVYQESTKRARTDGLGSLEGGAMVSNPVGAHGAPSMSQAPARVGGAQEVDDESSNDDEDDFSEDEE